MKDRTSELREEQARLIWKQGWDSAVSVAEDAIKELMSQWTEDFQTMTVRIPKENFEAMKAKVEAGLWKNIRVSQKGGLDFYFAQTYSSTLVEDLKS